MSGNRESAIQRLGPYSASDDSTWRKWYQVMRPLQDKKAFSGYQSAREEILNGSEYRVPHPEEIDERLKKVSGFSLLPVDGLTKYGDFFSNLGRKRFTAMSAVRTSSEWRFCSSPDWIHECVGHAVSLANEHVARLYQAFGKVVSAKRDKALLRRLGQLYWFTCEVGLVAEPSGLKAFGAALLSSPDELENVELADLREFNLSDMETLPFNFREPQRTYFVAESVGQMVENVVAHLEAMNKETL